MTDLRIGLLVSGRGSVLVTLLRACSDGRIPGTVVAVGANKPCPALDRARAAGVATVVSRPTADFRSRGERDATLRGDLREAGVNFIVVGGYDEVLESTFFSDPTVPIISMYPALLPAFGELEEAIGPAIEYGVKLIGVTIHFRTPMALSNGPIIAQRALDVWPNDTVETLTQRVIELESTFLPEVLGQFARGAIVREADRVLVHQARATS